MELKILSGEERNERVEKYKKFIKKRFKEYDPMVRGKEYKGESWNGRIQVYPHSFPPCSPVFLDELCRQIQKEIEKELGIKDIHTIPKTSFVMMPFFEIFPHVTGVEYFNEMEDEVCYSYAPCYFKMSSVYGDNYYDCDCMPIEKQSTLFWIRFYSLKNPKEPANVEADISSDDVRFEIIDYLPKSLPMISEFPPRVKERVLRSLNALSFKDWIPKLYDPNIWKEDAKLCINWILKKAKQETERKWLREKIAKSEQKKIPINAPKEILCWPDVLFTLKMKETVLEDVTDELYMVLSCVFDSLKGAKPEYYSVEKTGDKECTIAVDFGDCNVNVFKKIISYLEKTGMDIVSISIE